MHAGEARVVPEVRADADGEGGGIHITGSSPEITRTTIADNTALTGGGVYIIGASAPVFSNVIIAHNEGDGEVYCGGAASSPTFTCSDVFSKVGRPYGGFCDDPTGSSGNISADPLFCDPGNGDLHLHSASPCAEAHSGCGRVGAKAVNCE